MKDLRICCQPVLSAGSHWNSEIFVGTRMLGLYNFIFEKIGGAHSNLKAGSASLIYLWLQVSTPQRKLEDKMKTCIQLRRHLKDIDLSQTNVGPNKQ